MDPFLKNCSLSGWGEKQIILVVCGILDKMRAQTSWQWAGWGGDVPNGFKGLGTG